MTNDTKKDARHDLSALIARANKKDVLTERMDYLKHEFRGVIWPHIQSGQLKRDEALAAVFSYGTDGAMLPEMVDTAKDMLRDLEEWLDENRLLLTLQFQYNPRWGISTITETDSGEIRCRLLCYGLRFSARTRDARSDAVGAIVRVLDEDGRWREVAFQKGTLLAGDTALRPFTDAGLRIYGDAKMVRKLLGIVVARKAIIATEQIGWSKWEGRPVYIFPDVAVGEAGELPILFTGDDVARKKFSSAGTLGDWSKNVAGYAEGNSRLMLAISAALAAILLDPLNIEGGGFHFVGPSSKGKTTALQMASSVFGSGATENGYIQSWRATDNALEAVCYRHNHTLLAIDEIGQADKKSLGAGIYMVANGQGKTRMRADTSSRPTMTWRLLFISTGEHTIADHVERGGDRSTAGQAVRVVDIDADGGKGHGTFEKLYGMDAAAFADHLKAMTVKYYGVAGRAFAKHVAANYEGVCRDGAEQIDALTKRFPPAGADGQVSRVARRFALCAFAGELAREAGIVSWKAGAATAAAQRCFDDWLSKRGTQGALEIERGYENVLQFIRANLATRFQREGETDLARIVDCVGFYSGDPSRRETGELLDHLLAKKTSNSNAEIKRIANTLQSIKQQPLVVYIFNKSWPEVCGHSSPTDVARRFRSEGILKPGSKRDQTQQIRNGPYPRQRYYVLCLSDEEVIPEADVTDKHELVSEGTVH